MVPKESSTDAIPSIQTATRNPKGERMTDSSVDALVTASVALVLILLVLAYVYLCCHVWGIHLRLLRMVKCIGSREDSPSNPGGHYIQDGRPSISLPMPSAPELPLRHVQETPPPRYSIVNGLLPSYSCAMSRKLTLIGKPLQFRVLVHMSSLDLENSVFVSPAEKQPQQTPLESCSGYSAPPFPPLSPASSADDDAYFGADMNNNIPLASLNVPRVSESSSTSGHDDPGNALSDAENGLGNSGTHLDVTTTEASEQYVKVVVQREGRDSIQCMYARRTSPSCYEARWTLAPEDLTNNFTFQVHLEGTQVADVFLELLNGEGRVVSVDQLSPVPFADPPAYLTPAPTYVP